MKIAMLGIAGLVACSVCLWPNVTSAAGLPIPASAQGTSTNDYAPIFGGRSFRNNHFHPIIDGADLVANDLDAQGETLLKSGDAKSAIALFQQAIDAVPTDGLAYRRLAEAYTATGRLDEASKTFRKVLIEGFGPGIGNGIGETADVWSEYALVLVSTGQDAQAIQAYNHAVYLLDYQDSQYHRGQARLKVLLPEIVLVNPNPNQLQYAPERLQALASTALAYKETAFGSNKEAVTHSREAARLYPDSPVVQSYLGDVLAGAGDAAGAKAARARANALGLSRVTALLDAQTAIMQEQKGVK